MKLIYLDNNATSPLDPLVFHAMRQEFEGPPLNASSVHTLGQRAKQLLQKARILISAFFGFHPEELIFTSGGTESINLFLKSLPQGHIISSNIDHSAVYETLSTLDSKITFLAPNDLGSIDPSQLEAAIQPNTVAIVLTASNTETGIKLDLIQIGLIAQSHKIPLFIDAVSFVGKEILPEIPGLTALAISAHKFHGPKGVGALLVRSSFPLKALQTGGGQERSKRSGTENLAGIIGMAEAISILAQKQEEITKHILELRDLFEHTLKKSISNLIIHGEKSPRVCNVSNICFPNMDGESLLMQLDLLGIAASHGSACASGALEPSRVLLNMGISRKLARSSIRFSFSRMNSLEEIEKTVDAICQLHKK